jgi:hypothetical protein
VKKMPCLFQRRFEGNRVVALLPDVTPGCEWVLTGEGTASRKWDGTACMVKDGVLYKRYDAKRGKVPPPNAIPCDEPDAVTGHHPHWVPVDAANPADKWHSLAWAALPEPLPDGTYELIGPHINGNPEGAGVEEFRRHGDRPIDVVRTFDDIREYLTRDRLEGIVFAHPDGRMCKIRRNDFGITWGSK